MRGFLRNTEQHKNSRKVKPTCGDGSGSREKATVRVVASLDTVTAASSGGGGGDRAGGKSQYVSAKWTRLQRLHGL